MKNKYNSSARAGLGLLIAVCSVIFVNPAIGDDNKYYQIKWLSTGNILIYSMAAGSAFTLDLHDWKLTKLSYSTKGKSVNLSSSGKRLVVYDDLKEFQFGDSTGLLSKPIKIPLWLSIPPGEDRDQYLFYNVENRMFWLSDKTLLLNQRDRESGEVNCKPFDTETGQWKVALKHCIDTRSVNINDILYNHQNDILIVDGSVEGAQEINVVKWTREKGVQNANFPIPDLTNGIVKMGFNSDQGSLWLMSPCQLSATGGKARDKPCGKVDLYTSLWNHFRWSATQAGPVSLVRSGLPVNTIPSHWESNKYAWLKGESVCVGDPAKASNSRCMPLPK